MLTLKFFESRRCAKSDTYINESDVEFTRALSSNTTGTKHTFTGFHVHGTKKCMLACWLEAKEPKATRVQITL